MWLLIAILFQLYFERPMLEAEDARAEEPTALLEGLKNPDARIQRLAVRGVGRLERAALADSVRPLLSAADPGVRMEAINALGQMNATLDLAALLQNEKDAQVR